MAQAKAKDRSAKARGLKLVSFEIELGQWTQFRIKAISSGVTASELIRRLIDAELAKAAPRGRKKPK